MWIIDQQQVRDIWRIEKKFLFLTAEGPEVQLTNDTQYDKIHIL